MSLEQILAGARLVLETPDGLWLLLLAAPFLAWPLMRSEERRGWIASALLRAAALSSLVLVLAGLAIETPGPPAALCVVVATDRSQSMGAEAAALERQWLDRLARALGPRDRLGAVVFAREAEVTAFAEPLPPRSVAPAAIDDTATNLEAGIATALSLCPESLERKIVIVSDGNQTEGDARRGATLAARMKVPLFPIAHRPGGVDAPSFEKLIAPPVVRQGSVFPLRLVVRTRNGEALRGALEVAIDGQEPMTEAVELENGLNVFELQPTIVRSGAVRVAARLKTEGGGSSPRREVTLSVAGPVRALVLSERKDPAPARALRVKGVEVEVRRAQDLRSAEALTGFDCLILDDVPRAALGNAALAAIEGYVRDLGGGLVFTGGARSFGDKSYEKSALARLLPVELSEQKKPPPGRKPIGVFLLVDRSNSMSYSGRTREVRDGEKIRYAKQAALALVDQLRDVDSVGVIAFDAKPYVLAPLRPLEGHRAHLVDRIQHLSPGGGTDFKEALEIAGAQLAASAVRVRHIILLTDGDSNRGGTEHDALVATLASMRISVTTLRIGLDDINLELLRQISDRTGGVFYHVDDLDELPKILVHDARRVDAGEPPEDATGGESERMAAIDRSTEILRGFAAADFPPIRDPIKTKAKRGADVVLSIPEGAGRLPLVATWQVGRGRIAALPLEPATAGVRWAAWSGYGKLWSQLVRWAMREEGAWQVRHQVRVDGDRTVLDLETLSDIGETTLEAEIASGTQPPMPIRLMPVGPRSLRGTLPALPDGAYGLTVSWREGDRVRARKSDVVTIAAAPVTAVSAAELVRDEADLDLLRDLARESGGAVDPALETVTARIGRAESARSRLDLWLLGLSIACVLGDVAVRQWRW